MKRDLLRPAPASTSLPVRITVGVVLCWVLSETVEFGRTDDRGLEWCAFTVIVIAAPTLGSVVAKGLDRVVGTVLGGLVAVMVCLHTLNTAWMVAITFLIAFGGVILAEVLKKDYSMKLFILTFLIVAIGSEARGPKEIWALAFTRTLGIVAGVIMVTLLTIIVWPKADSTTAVSESRAALSALASLQEATWENGAIASGWSILAANRSFKLRLQDDYIPTPGPEDNSHPEEDEEDGDEPKPLPGGSSPRQRPVLQRPPLCKTLTAPRGEFQGMGPIPLNTEEDVDDMEGRLEEVIDKILASLTKAEASAKASHSEIYVGSLQGWPVFLPGLEYNWARVGWQVPQEELLALGATIRNVVRLYWSMQRSFQDGFDEDLMKVVKARYPADMLTTLQEGSHAVLKEILKAFPAAEQLKPSQEKVALGALIGFCTDVKAFTSIGSQQRHDFQATLDRLHQAPTRSSRLRGLDSLRAFAHQDIMGSAEDAGASASRGLESARTEPDSQTLEDAMALAREQAQENFRAILEAAEDHQAGTKAHPPAGRENSLESCLAGLLSHPRNQGDAARLLRCQRTTSAPAEFPPSPGEEGSILDSAEPQGASATPLPGMFPDSANGHICKVRWYSFLFLVERLAILLVELHEDVDDLLWKLPGCGGSAADTVFHP